jgi:hypothetical protein
VPSPTRAARGRVCSRCKSRQGNDYSIVDGPFSEAKEIVGGYLLVDVADREAAIALTRRFLDVAGEGTCHLHEIVGPPDEKSG